MKVNLNHIIILTEIITCKVDLPGGGGNWSNWGLEINMLAVKLSDSVNLNLSS